MKLPKRKSQKNPSKLKNSDTSYFNENQLLLFLESNYEKIN